jgi:uncharacterized protein (DUF427 family)
VDLSLDAVKARAMLRGMAHPAVENVEDYPRPPAIGPVGLTVRLVVDGETVAETAEAWRICETHHPPGYYLPRRALRPGLLGEAQGGSFCEWKGRAVYFDVIGRGGPVRRGAWSYPAPAPSYAAIAGHVAFYLSERVQGWVGTQQALPQPGRFYGGWVTPNLTGRIKGAPGTLGW